MTTEYQGMSRDGAVRADAPSAAGRPGPSPMRMVMLVSGMIESELRTEVADRQRPRPEFLALEQDYGVELLDWSLLPKPPQRRTPRGSLSHVAWAMRHGRRATAILTDGEHLGLPMAAALALRPRRPGHVMLAHHLSTPAKRRLLRIPGLVRGVDAFVVHSQAQVDTLVEDVGLPAAKVRLLRYGVDTTYWSATDGATELLIASPGREHRDHVTLSTAVEGLDAKVFVTDGSSFSPAARRRVPDHWPANIERGALGIGQLRDLYGRAAVVVVPLMPTDFPAGITVVAEAMSMGKPVVVTGTHGLRGALADSEAVVTVPAEDPSALREAVARLLEDPALRAGLGARAQELAVSQHDVGTFSAGLHSLLLEAADRG